MNFDFCGVRNLAGNGASGRVDHSGCPAAALLTALKIPSVLYFANSSNKRNTNFTTPHAE